MRNSVGYCVLGVLALLLGACTKSTPAGDTSKTIGQNLETFKTKLLATQLLTYHETRGAQADSSIPFGVRAALAANWTNPANAFNSLTNGGAVTVKEYMGEALDRDLVNTNGAYVTVFGRFEETGRILCAIGLALPHDAYGNPDVGSFTPVIDSQAEPYKSQCKFSQAFSTIIPVTVTATTDSTLYLRKIALTPPGARSSETFLMGFFESGSLNLLAVEDQSPDRDQVSRTIGHYDAVAKTMRFEYISQGFSGMTGYEFDRLYLNETTDVGAIVSSYGARDFSNYVKFAIKGKPATEGATVALSLTSFGQTTTLTDANACVNPDTGDIVSDNTLACTATGTAVSAATAIANNHGAHSAIADYEIGETMQAPFTDDTTIFTAFATN